MGENKVCLVVPYYGEFPWWLVFFLESVKLNPAYSWLLVSDKKPETELSPNVSFLKLSIEEFQDLISETLGVSPQLDFPYKICDFKPAFGKIFKKQLTGFSYWGYCDLDLVFGNIGHLLDDILNKGYDVISPDKDFFPGHFCLFRNRDFVNNLYKSIDGYKAVLSSEKVFLIDEFIHRQGILPAKKEITQAVDAKIRRHKRLSRVKANKVLRLLLPVYRILKRVKPGSNTKTIDFNSVLRTAERNNELNVYRCSMYDSDVRFFCDEVNSAVVRWRDGRLFYDGELLYFHFQLSKKNNMFRIERVQGGFDLKL